MFSATDAPLIDHSVRVQRDAMKNLQLKLMVLCKAFIPAQTVTLYGEHLRYISYHNYSSTMLKWKTHLLCFCWPAPRRPEGSWAPLASAGIWARIQGAGSTTPTGREEGREYKKREGCFIRYVRQFSKTQRWSVVALKGMSHVWKNKRTSIFKGQWLIVRKCPTVSRNCFLVNNYQMSSSLRARVIALTSDHSVLHPSEILLCLPRLIHLFPYVKQKQNNKICIWLTFTSDRHK